MKRRDEINANAQIVRVLYDPENSDYNSLYLYSNGYTIGYNITPKDLKTLDIEQPEETPQFKKDLCEALHVYFRDPAGKHLRFDYLIGRGLVKIDPEEDENAKKLDWVNGDRDALSNFFDDGAYKIQSYFLTETEDEYKIRTYTEDRIGDRRSFLEADATESDRIMLNLFFKDLLSRLYSSIQLHDQLSLDAGILIFEKNGDKLIQRARIDKEELINADLFNIDHSQNNLDQYLKDHNISGNNLDWQPIKTELVPESLIKDYEQISKYFSGLGRVNANYTKALNDFEEVLYQAFNKLFDPNMALKLALPGELKMAEKPKYFTKLNYLPITAIFDPRNTVDENYNLQLVDYEDNIMQVGYDYDNKEPIFSEVEVTFNKKIIKELYSDLYEELKNSENGASPLDPIKFKMFQTICSYALQYFNNTGDFYKDIKAWYQTAPWIIRENDLVKACFNINTNPTKKQIEEVRNCFITLMSTPNTIDNTHQARVYFKKSLEELYKSQGLDTDSVSFRRDLKNVESLYSTKKATIIKGEFTNYSNKNLTESNTYTIDDIPGLKNVLLTNQYQSIPFNYYELPDNKKKVKNNNFFILRDELISRIVKALRLIRDGKESEINKSKNNKLLTLDLESFFQKNKIEFTSKLPRREKSNLIEQVINAIEEKFNDDPNFYGILKYPGKKRVKTTHLVIGYNDNKGNPIFSNKMIEAFQAKKERESKEEASGTKK